MSTKKKLIKTLKKYKKTKYGSKKSFLVILTREKNMIGKPSKNHAKK
jgi:hypothetical protein